MLILLLMPDLAKKDSTRQRWLINLATTIKKIPLSMVVWFYTCNHDTSHKSSGGYDNTYHVISYRVVQFFGFLPHISWNIWQYNDEERFYWTKIIFLTHGILNYLYCEIYELFFGNTGQQSWNTELCEIITTWNVIGTIITRVALAIIISV